MERLSFQHRWRPPRHNAIASVMKRAAPMSVVAVAARAGENGADSAAEARALCVVGPHCYPTIQATLDASRDGDTIKVGPGTFAGGVTTDRSITLVGVAAAATAIHGGGVDLVVRTVAC